MVVTFIYVFHLPVRMRDFTRKDIETTRQFLEGNGAFKERASVVGHSLDYLVAPQSIQPKLPDFAIVQKGMTPEDGLLLAVSDSVPELFRPCWMLHEFVETLGDRRQLPDGCLDALRIELRAVPYGVLPVYGPRRLAFFGNLVKYASENSYPDADIARFKLSLDHLKQLGDKGWNWRQI